MGGKTGGGQPQQQNAMGAGGAGAGMGQANSMAGLKGGGGAPQNQMGQMPQGQMPQRPDPAMLQQLQAMAQSRGMMGGQYGRPGQGFGGMMGGEKPMMGGINSLQGDPNTMPPPAAATGSSPGGPLSGRFGGWGAQQRGMGWGGGGGMGRFGGFGRNFGGPPPGGGFGGGATPAGAVPGGLAALQAMNQAAPTTGAPLMADQMPQQGYAVGGTVAAPAAAPARVSWSPTGMGFRGGAAAPTSGTGTGMFPSVQKLATIQQPAAYVPAVQQAMWSPPTTAAASTANTGGPYGGLTMAAWAKKHGYGTLNPSTGIYEKSYRGGSGSHGGGRG